MTRGLEDELPLRRPLEEHADVPAWMWFLLGAGLAVGFFGLLVLIMGAMMSETAAPRSGDYIHVDRYHVSSWLFWLGGCCIVLGTGLCWPGYRASFGRSQPGPRWLGPVGAGVALACSLAALPVALAAAPASHLHGQAYEVTAFVWVMVLAGGIAAIFQWSRDRRREEGGGGDGGAVAAGEADDPVR